MSGPFNTRTFAILRALCDFAVSLSGLLSNADIPEINRPARTVCPAAAASVCQGAGCLSPAVECVRKPD